MTPLSGSPSMLTVIHSGKVRARATATNTQAATNLPSTADVVDSGMVISNSMVPLLRSEAHRDRRDQEQVQPGMKGKERLQARLPALEEAADVERQRARQREKDDDEDIGDRRREVAGEFAPGDRARFTQHGRSRFVWSACGRRRRAGRARPAAPRR